MKIAICIFHPAHVHNFRNLIKLLEENGHQTLVLASDKDNTFDLLNRYQIPFIRLSYTTGRNFFHKAFLFFSVTFKIFRACQNYSVDLILDRALPVTAIAAFFLNLPHYIFDDTEITPVAWKINKILAKKIITPEFFLLDLGKKHIKINTYKELFYLHPDYFIPNRNKIKFLKLKNDEKYSVVRFVSWDATHDLGHSGLTNQEKLILIKYLEQFGKVFISSEKRLSSEFEKFRLDIPLEDIHHVLYYATIFIGEGGTMNSEASILGTHTINLCEMILGSHEELSNKYKLMYSFRDKKIRLDQTLEQIGRMFQIENIWALGKEKRKRLLNENINGTIWLYNFLIRDWNA